MDTHSAMHRTFREQLPTLSETRWEITSWLRTLRGCLKTVLALNRHENALSLDRSLVAELCLTEIRKKVPAEMEVSIANYAKTLLATNFDEDSEEVFANRLLVTFLDELTAKFPADGKAIRREFASLVQTGPVAVYAARLRDLADPIGVTEEVLMERFLNGLRSRTIRDLLESGDYATFENMEAKAIKLEASEKERLAEAAPSGCDEGRL